ncbi:hypothetical protein BKA63DRAFT_489160 [Paraphoma chrysanthemicola]|nr:hypothetical protein BKA63DRAFT_489160 [Paraphoma chrysanthemicola]
MPLPTFAEFQTLKFADLYCRLLSRFSACELFTIFEDVHVFYEDDSSFKQMEIFHYKIEARLAAERDWNSMSREQLIHQVRVLGVLGPREEITCTDLRLRCLLYREAHEVDAAQQQQIKREEIKDHRSAFASSVPCLRLAKRDSLSPQFGTAHSSCTHNARFSVTCARPIPIPTYPLTVGLSAHLHSQLSNQPSTSTHPSTCSSTGDTAVHQTSTSSHENNSRSQTRFIMSSQQFQSEPSSSHKSSTSHARDVSLNHRIKAHGHLITSKQARGTNSGVVYPLPPRPAHTPFTGGDCYMPNRNVSTRHDRPTRPRLYDSYIPDRDRSHSSRRDDRSRRPVRHPYAQYQKYRARSPARETTISQPERPYQVDPIKTKGDSYHPTYPNGAPPQHAAAHPTSGETTLDARRSSSLYILTSSQHDAYHRADGTIDNILKQGMLTGRPTNPGSPASDNHGSRKQPYQPRQVSGSYRPRPMLMHRRPVSEPPYYANWTEKHLLDEVNVRRLSYGCENATYLAEILHVNDSKFNER